MKCARRLNSFSYEWSRSHEDSEMAYYKCFRVGEGRGEKLLNRDCGEQKRICAVVHTRF